MDGVLTLDNNVSLPLMNKTKARKVFVMSAIRSKVEQAKLNLIYTELEENNIKFERKYTTVKKLRKDLKNQLNSLDYNKFNTIAERVNNSVNEMVDNLDRGSTNAFTKLMTGNLSKTIAKTLGISLAGRTALLLVPTIGTKALVASGLSCYGLYRIAKNRKDIIKTNETNELNSILMDLETTKENDEYIDTRFSEEIQKYIKSYLESSSIKFEYTGYKSLRSAIYSLDNEHKKELCSVLKSKLGREIDIEKRLSKAKNKFNIIGSTVAGVSAGAALGSNVATTINALDPGLAAGLLNGTFLGV